MEIECLKEEKNENGWLKDSMSVRVALRVRPMLPREIMENNQKCIQVDIENKEVIIGKTKSFTFNKVFDESSTQSDIYEHCAKDLALGCFEGYNATVLAYG